MSEYGPGLMIEKSNGSLLVKASLPKRYRFMRVF